MRRTVSAGCISSRGVWGIRCPDGCMALLTQRRVVIEMNHTHREKLGPWVTRHAGKHVRIQIYYKIIISITHTDTYIHTYIHTVHTGAARSDVETRPELLDARIFAGAALALPVSAGGLVLGTALPPRPRRRAARAHASAAHRMAHTCMAQCECTGYLTVYNDARHGYRTRVAAARLPYKLYDTTVPSSSVVALVPPPPPGARPRRARLAPPTCNNISEVDVEASHAAVNCCPTPKCSPPRPPPYIKPLRTCMCRRTPSPPPPAAASMHSASPTDRERRWSGAGSAGWLVCARAPHQH